MKRLLILLALIGLMAAPAQASVLNDLVADGVTINQLEDNDFESLLGDGDSIVEVGEDLVAMFEISFLDAPIGSSKEVSYSSTMASFTGVSVIRATSVAGAGTGTASFGFGAAPAASWAALGLPSPTAAGTMIMLFDDPASSPADHIVATTGTLAGSLATATNGTLLWEFGFRGDAGEFWSATSTDTLPVLPPHDATDITKIETLSFFAGLNVTATHAVPASLILLKHDHVGFGATTQIQLVGALAPGQNPAGSDFDIATDTDAFLLPTPEPASMLVWAGMLGCAGLGLYRRRRKSQA